MEIEYQTIVLIIKKMWNRKVKVKKVNQEF
jgi:hypothetical protein